MRKSPIRHRVREHKRNGYPVHSYMRGEERRALRRLGVKAKRRLIHKQRRVTRPVERTTFPYIVDPTDTKLVAKYVGNKVYFVPKLVKRLEIGDIIKEHGDFYVFERTGPYGEYVFKYLPKVKNPNLSEKEKQIMKQTSTSVKKSNDLRRFKEFRPAIKEYEKTVTRAKQLRLKPKPTVQTRLFKQLVKNEMKEHPWLKRTQAERIVREHIRKNPSVVSVANQVLKDLKPYSEKIEVAGSIRRGKTDPKDVDILLVPKDVKAIEKIKKYGVKKDQVRLKGNKIISFVKHKIQVDVYITEPKSWGAMVMFLTGPSGYNIGLRIIAKKKGKLLNQYGLFDRKTKRFLAGKTEASIYKALGKTWKAPALRGK